MTAPAKRGRPKKAAENPEYVIDDKCLMCGAIFRIVSDKQRVKTTCDNCGARFMTVKGKVREA